MPDPNIVDTLCRQKHQLIQMYNHSLPNLKQCIDDTKSSAFDKAFPGVPRQYDKLKYFCAGLATSMSGTHAVEGDFSVLKFTKSPNRYCMFTYSMEGQIHAKEYQPIRDACLYVWGSLDPE